MSRQTVYNLDRQVWTYRVEKERCSDGDLRECERDDEDFFDFERSANTKLERLTPLRRTVQEFSLEN